MYVIHQDFNGIKVEIYIEHKYGDVDLRHIGGVDSLSRMSIFTQISIEYRE